MEKINFKDYNSPFAMRLRELIDERQTKRIELAELLGVSRQSIGQYCDGTSLPPVDKIVMLAGYYNVSTDYLLGRTGVKATDPTIKEICHRTGLTDESIKVLENYNIENENFIFALNLMLHQECSNDGQIRPVLSRISDFLNTYIEGCQIYKFEDGQLKKDSQHPRQKFKFNNQNRVRPFSLRLIVHELMLNEIEQALRELKLRIYPESGEN